MTGSDDLPPDEGTPDEAALAVSGEAGGGDAGADDSRPRAKKAPNAFRTISEVADELHIPQPRSPVLGNQVPADQAAQARRRAALLPP